MSIMVPFPQFLRDYYAVLTVALSISGIVWGVRSAYQTILSKLDKLDANHLVHVQAATEKAADELSKLRESSGRNEAQHEEQIRLLGDIRDSLRSKNRLRSETRSPCF